jgi:RNA polymerase subunit RPABC4/transcription elongation factor Spt4
MTQPRSRFEEELKIIPTGWVVVSVIAFAAIQVLFHFCIPMWSHRHDLPPEPWWALLAILGGVVMAAMILLIGYVYADARRRGMNAVLWTLLVIFLPKLLGFVVYFLLRKPLLQPCPNCRWPIGSDFAYCPKCGHALAPSCANCGRAVRRDYQCCPYCGKALGATATS